MQSTFVLAMLLACTNAVKMMTNTAKPERPQVVSIVENVPEIMEDVAQVVSIVENVPEIMEDVVQVKKEEEKAPRELRDICKLDSDGVNK